MRNKPFAAQQPPPAFANDPSGFFVGVLAANRTEGISSLLPAGTVIQSDVAAKGRLLAAQIAWSPAIAIWNGCDLIVSLSDAQFLLSNEEGGPTQQGRVTVLVDKLKFSGFGKGLPDYNQTFRIQAGGVWHEFTIAEIVGKHDDNEPSLMLFLEKDSNAIGE